MEDIFQLGIKALIRNRKGEILLLKVNENKLVHDEKRGLVAKPYWDIPGERLEKNGNVIDTLEREVKEETGIEKINNIKEFTILMSNIRVPYKSESAGLILNVFTCHINEGIKILLSDEHEDCAWFPPRKAAELLKIKYPKEFTQKIKNLE